MQPHLLWMLPLVCPFLQKHRASPWNLLHSESRVFCQHQMLECSGLGIIEGITSISGTVLIELFTLRGRGGDSVGVWCPPCFFDSVGSPLYLILPGHQLLPEQHLPGHTTLPLRSTPLPFFSHPPIHPYNGCPCGQAVVGEAKFTLLEWLQWQLCFYACMQGLVLYGLLHGATANCSFDKKIVKHTTQLTDWLIGQNIRHLGEGMHRSVCMSNSVQAVWSCAHFSF